MKDKPVYRGASLLKNNTDPTGSGVYLDKNLDPLAHTLALRLGEEPNSADLAVAVPEFMVEFDIKELIE